MALDYNKKTSVDAERLSEEFNAFQNEETEICPSNIVKEDINNFYGYDPYSKYSEMYPEEWKRMMREIMAVGFRVCSVWGVQFLNGYVNL